MCTRTGPGRTVRRPSCERVAHATAPGTLWPWMPPKTVLSSCRCTVTGCWLQAQEAVAAVCRAPRRRCRARRESARCGTSRVARRDGLVRRRAAASVETGARGPRGRLLPGGGSFDADGDLRAGCTTAVVGERLRALLDSGRGPGSGGPAARRAETPPPQADRHAMSRRSSAGHCDSLEEAPVFLGRRGGSPQVVQISLVPPDPLWVPHPPGPAAEPDRRHDVEASTTASTMGLIICSQSRRWRTELSRRRQGTPCSRGQAAPRKQGAGHTGGQGASAPDTSEGRLPESPSTACSMPTWAVSTSSM